MSRKMLSLFTFAVMGASCFAAEKNLISFAGCENAAVLKKCGAGVKLSTVKPRSGKSCMRIEAAHKFLYSEKIKIDPSKKYKLTIWFRAENAAKAAPFFAGIQSYDKNNKPISGENVRYFDGTLTTVTADALKGESVLQVENASQYKKGWTVALSAKVDCSDLPNRNLIGGVKAIKGNELTLQTPLKVDVAAGTKIRQHIGGWQYSLNHGGKAPVQWKEYSCIFNGRNDKRGENNQFWPGTCYIQIVIAANMARNGSVLYADDFKLVEIGPAANKK